MSKIFEDEIKISPNINCIGANAVFKISDGVGGEEAKLRRCALMT